MQGDALPGEAMSGPTGWPRGGAGAAGFGSSMPKFSWAPPGTPRAAPRRAASAETGQYSLEPRCALRPVEGSMAPGMPSSSTIRRSSTAAASGSCMGMSPMALKRGLRCM